MASDGKARVFMSGRSQAVWIPVEFRFSSEDVFIRRDPQSGEIILSERLPHRSLTEIFAMIDEAGGAEQLLQDRDTATAQERDWI